MYKLQDHFGCLACRMKCDDVSPSGRSSPEQESKLSAEFTSACLFIAGTFTEYTGALQAAVYTARAGKGSQRRIKARTCHAPARRLARTTISLGPDEGILFGLRAIRCAPAFPKLLQGAHAPVLSVGVQLYSLATTREAALVD